MQMTLMIGQDMADPSAFQMLVALIHGDDQARADADDERDKRIFGDMDPLGRKGGIAQGQRKAGDEEGAKGAAR